MLCFYPCLFVCLFVCPLDYLKKLWTADLDEIFGEVGHGSKNNPLDSGVIWIQDSWVRIAIRIQEFLKHFDKIL